MEIIVGCILLALIVIDIVSWLVLGRKKNVNEEIIKNNISQDSTRSLSVNNGQYYVKEVVNSILIVKLN